MRGSSFNTDVRHVMSRRRQSEAEFLAFQQQSPSLYDEFFNSPQQYSSADDELLSMATLQLDQQMSEEAATFACQKDSQNQNATASNLQQQELLQQEQEHAQVYLGERENCADEENQE